MITFSTSPIILGGVIDYLKRALVASYMKAGKGVMLTTSTARWVDIIYPRQTTKLSKLSRRDDGITLMFSVADRNLLTLTGNKQN